MKVVSGLEQLKESLQGKDVRFSSPKKQAQAIETLEKAVEYVEDLEERVAIMEEGVVYCRECENYKSYGEFCGICGRWDEWTDPDTFCSCGERKGEKNQQEGSED